MKKLAILLLSTNALLSCGNQNGTSTETKADSLCAKDTVMQIDAAKKESLEIKTYSKYALFLADYKPRDIYHENQISIDWPESAEGYDVKKIQKLVANLIHAEIKDIRKYVNDWVASPRAEIPYEWDYKKVSERRERTDDEEADDSEDDYAQTQYDTRNELEVTFNGIDSKRNIMTFCKSYCDDLGCGLGSCVYFGYDYLVYDYKNDKVVNWEDIFVSEGDAIYHLNKQRIGAEEYEELASPDKTIGLGGTFYIEDNVVMFVYDKYEITYGAAGCPQIGLDVSRCPYILTEYGKKLFGVKPAETPESYEQFAGYIGPYDITMFINWDEEEGYYYYNNRPKNKFTLKVYNAPEFSNLAGNGYMMKEYTSSGFNSGTFQGCLITRGEGFNGTFINSKKKKFDFNLMPIHN